MKIKNNKKQIMKNNNNKKMIFVHKIHKWLNFILNDLLKSINIFNINSNRRFEKIENEITRQINKNKKQSDHTNVNQKDWPREIFAFSQDWNLIIWTIFAKWANKCQNMWWWTAS